MTEAAAREDGTAVSAVTVDIDESSRAWLHGAADRGFVKLVADTDRQILLGATVVAPTASELLAQLTLAVHAAVPLRQLLSMIYAFPSFHDAVEAAIRKLGVSRM
jgi:pyruvate/2-oxoglutarate dehydrogenase complex dihydrolipoamide dehydrogenase (E3) component